VDDQDRVGLRLVDLGQEILGHLRVIADQVAADELDVAQPLLHPGQIRRELLLNLLGGVEVGLGPRPTRPQVDDVDLHRRHRRPAGLFGGPKRARRDSPGQQQAARAPQERATIHRKWHDDFSCDSISNRTRQL